MSKRQKNNSNKREQKGRYLMLLVLGAAALITAIGSVFAYYSDLLIEGNELNTNTLKIACTYTYYLNGNEVDIETAQNINPGDAIVIKGEVSNNGTQSAWIREKISFEADSALVGFLRVFSGEYTQGELFLGEDLEGELEISPTDYAVGANKVIDGKGATGEKENDGRYICLGASSYEFKLTIYFDLAATNDTQDKPLGLELLVQALQFKNNNATEPTEEMWNAVVAAQ